MGLDGRPSVVIYRGARVTSQKCRRDPSVARSTPNRPNSDPKSFEEVRQRPAAALTADQVPRGSAPTLRGGAKRAVPEAAKLDGTRTGRSRRRGNMWFVVYNHQSAPLEGPTDPTETTREGFFCRLPHQQGHAEGIAANLLQRLPRSPGPGKGGAIGGAVRLQTAAIDRRRHAVRSRIRCRLQKPGR